MADPWDGICVMITNTTPVSKYFKLCWPVCTIKCQPKRQGHHLVTAKTIYNYFSYIDFSLACVPKVWLSKAMGCWSWSKTTPNPNLEASDSIIKDLEKSVVANARTVNIACFSARNACSTSMLHPNLSFFRYSVRGRTIWVYLNTNFQL